MTVEKVSVVLIVSLIAVLSALLSACANRGRTGMTTRGKERARAPGKPKEWVQKGRGWSGNGFAWEFATLSVRTDRRGRSRTGGHGQSTGGARPDTARHKGRIGKGRVEQGVSC